MNNRGQQIALVWDRISWRQYKVLLMSTAMQKLSTEEESRNVHEDCRGNCEHT